MIFCDVLLYSTRIAGAADMSSPQQLTDASHVLHDGLLYDHVLFFLSCDDERNGTEETIAIANDGSECEGGCQADIRTTKSNII